jgi:flavin reductase (DIM6/NTAB) family NADH-FMN oxidoreductase RutF
MTTLATRPQHKAGRSPRPIPSSSIDGRLLRNTLKRHAAGVTVLTAPGPVGFTATSFTPVSLEPALVSFYIGQGASARPAFEANDHFGVNILGEHQADLASRFAQRGIDRFAQNDWAADDDGVPLLSGVAAWLRGRITLRQVIGDHVLIVGEVVAVGGSAAPAGSSALVHHHGRIVGLSHLDAESRAIA